MKINQKILFISIILIILLFLILSGSAGLVIVGAGERGVILSFGQVQTNILNEGLHLVFPLKDKVIPIDVKVQKTELLEDSASKDLQSVTVKLAVNYRLDANKVGEIYQNIGNLETVNERIINPAVSEVTKATMAQYNVEEILTKRPEVKEKIDEGLKSRLSKFNILFEDVSIVNIEFSKEYNTAIEAKQVAQQRVQQAEFEKQQAEIEAKKRIVVAQGEAEAQRLQQQTLSTPLLQKMWIDKWDGKLPLYSGNANMFLDLKDLK